MSKTKTAFFCSNCGYESTKWLGKCPSCNTWNSFVEEVIEKSGDKKEEKWKNYHEERKPSGAVLVSDIEGRVEKTFLTPDADLNRVLGGGIVPGSIILV